MHLFVGWGLICIMISLLSAAQHGLVQTAFFFCLPPVVVNFAGATIRQHFGPLTLYRIRETTSLREEGGIGRFVQAFISEVSVGSRRHTYKPIGHASKVANHAVLVHPLRQADFAEILAGVWKQHLIPFRSVCVCVCVDAGYCYGTRHVSRRQRSDCLPR